MTSLLLHTESKISVQFFGNRWFCLVYKNPLLFSILSQLNLVQIFSFCFCKMNFIMSFRLCLGLQSKPHPFGTEMFSSCYLIYILILSSHLLLYHLSKLFFCFLVAKSTHLLFIFTCYTLDSSRCFTKGKTMQILIFNDAKTIFGLLKEGHME
jgi:hypothetical protein